MFKIIKKKCYLGRHKLGGYSYTKIEITNRSGYYKKVVTEVNRSFVHLEEIIRFAEENKCLINLLGFENQPSFINVKELKKMYCD